MTFTFLQEGVISSSIENHHLNRDPEATTQPGATTTACNNSKTVQAVPLQHRLRYYSILETSMTEKFGIFDKILCIVCVESSIKPLVGMKHHHEKAPYRHQAI